MEISREQNFRNVQGRWLMSNSRMEARDWSEPRFAMQVAQTKSGVNVFGVERGQQDVRH